MLLGYCRTSTADQNPDHQIDALLRNGVDRDNIHIDVASGAKASRPKLDLVMQLMREGDTLKVTRLDRLSRSVLHLVETCTRVARASRSSTTWCASSRITGTAVPTGAGSPPRTPGTRTHSRCTPESNASATAVDARLRDRGAGCRNPELSRSAAVCLAENADHVSNSPTHERLSRCLGKYPDSTSTGNSLS
ncbi:recombinase family protein [Streptomyces sp. NPDC005774]|uniref:recombinase family protein n=1 Tax=Streptomyces sp. NPDC005774 TaxID=3364728 RepID=UPI0036B38FC8